MTQFIEIHTLTAYPASCLVRDDANRPKTVMVGGTQRGRVSSAALKRAIRTSEVFANDLNYHLGARTQRLGVRIVEDLTKNRGIDPAAALAVARQVVAQFGAVKDAKSTDPAEIEQLAFIDPSEADAALSIARRIAAGETVDPAEMREMIQPYVTAVDIALFGRLFAARGELKLPAAAAVMHPTTVGKIAVESDYYVAVDDWRDTGEDAGSAFIGNQGFYSGVFYGYVSLDKDQLVRNLNGDVDLANRGIAAFLRALATVAPTGKQSAFGSKARASFAMVQRTAVPRSLFSAFVRPVNGGDQLAESVDRLTRLDAEITRAYGDEPDAVAVMDLVNGVGTLADLTVVAQGGSE